MKTDDPDTIHHLKERLRFMELYVVKYPINSKKILIHTIPVFYSLKDKQKMMFKVKFICFTKYNVMEPNP